MEQYYTVSSAKRLDGADNYGNVTDSVYFEGEQESALWKHAPSTQVEKGLKVYGVIEELPTRAGGTYRKFTKKQVPEDGVQGHSEASGGVSGQKTGSNSSYNQDGARQGMAINNAAMFVFNTIPEGTVLTPQELADEIKKYARAIYLIDLTKPTEEEILEMMAN